MLSIIVAYDQKHGIGIKNTLPWKLKDDLKYFKSLTQDNYIVMGRKTFDSIGQKALPQRNNIILTRKKNYQQKKCTIVHNIRYIIELVNRMPKKNIFIIGGAEIYRIFLKYANRLYITRVKTEIITDCFFPNWNKSQFKCISVRHFQKNQDNNYNFDCEIWDRIIFSD